MAVYTIGDLHLSLGGDHSMNVFPGWENYVERIKQNWQEQVHPQDTVVLAGDTSWGMSLEEALPDFHFLENLPGKKILLKGNHDYWWTTKTKMDAFFCENGLNSLEILHNNTIVTDGIAVCGSRGWLLETGKAFDTKIIRREAIRLELSLSEGAKTGFPVFVFLHYPPIYGDSICPEIFDVLGQFGVQQCYYGHIHADGCRWAVNGKYCGIEFHLVSGDYRKFRLLPVTEGQEGEIGRKS